MTGHALRQARNNAGMTQVEAAARLGVSQTLLSLMEKGERSDRLVTLLRPHPETAVAKKPIGRNLESSCPHE